MTITVSPSAKRLGKSGISWAITANRDSWDTHAAARLKKWHSVGFELEISNRHFFFPKWEIMPSVMHRTLLLSK